MNYEVLLAGAAAAAGPAPKGSEDYQVWLNNVATIAADLGTIAEGVEAHEQRKSDCVALGEAEGTKKTFYGRLAKVKSITKGSDDKKVVKGYLQFVARNDSQSVDDEGFEFIETPPLSTPEGAFEYQRAQSLVGSDVIVYKRLIPLANGRRARECAAIDPARRTFQTDGDASAPKAPAAAEPAAAPVEAPKDTALENPAPEYHEADLDAAMNHAAEVFADPSDTPANVVAEPTPPVNTQLGSMAPKTEQELVDLAGKHLGKSPDEVRALLVAKYNVPAGKSLPPRQYSAVWSEMIA